MLTAADEEKHSFWSVETSEITCFRFSKSICLNSNYVYVNKATNTSENWSKVEKFRT